MATYRIERLSGPGLSADVDTDGYDTPEAAEAMVADYDGDYQIVRDDGDPVATSSSGEMIELTCYVAHDGMLHCSDTAEELRRATPDERRASEAETSGTGHISTEVAARTLRARAPHWCRLQETA